MSSCTEPAAAYHPSSAAPAADYTTAPPPPAGYPQRDAAFDVNFQNKNVPVETKSKGDGFWKGCCAALCCCCVLDACF